MMGLLMVGLISSFHCGLEVTSSLRLNKADIIEGSLQLEVLSGIKILPTALVRKLLAIHG
jgi:hypothetical protein